MYKRSTIYSTKSFIQNQKNRKEEEGKTKRFKAQLILIKSLIQNV